MPEDLCCCLDIKSDVLMISADEHHDTDPKHQYEIQDCGENEIDMNLVIG